jgi:putative glutamine amidotransferase
MELDLCRVALERGLPLLGICRGIQVLNVAAGGTLLEDIEARVPGALAHRIDRSLPRNHPAHRVRVEAGSRLAAALGAGSGGGSAREMAVNSTHHQAVDRLATGFLVSARAPDGVVEAIEATGDVYALGVQWHPEELVPQRGDMCGLFSHFLERCRVG